MDHKHKGVERSNGSLRAHPIERKHKDINARIEHNKVLTTRQKKYFQETGITTNPKIKKPTREDFLREVDRQKTPLKDINEYSLPVDHEGYVVVDFSNFPHKGLRIKKQQNKGGKRRTIGWQIPKEIDLFY